MKTWTLRLKRRLQTAYWTRHCHKRIWCFVIWQRSALLTVQTRELRIWLLNWSRLSMRRSQRLGPRLNCSRLISWLRMSSKWVSIKQVKSIWEVRESTADRLIVRLNALRKKLANSHFSKLMWCWKPKVSWKMALNRSIRSLTSRSHLRHFSKRLCVLWSPKFNLTFEALLLTRASYSFRLCCSDLSFAFDRNNLMYPFKFTCRNFAWAG